MAVQQVTDNEFEAEVLNADGPVLVDFWAEWCGPCRAFLPTLEAVSEEKGEAVKVVKVNIDQNPEAPSKYGVRSIPTIMMFKGGEVVAQNVGGMTKNDLTAWVDQATA